MKKSKISAEIIADSRNEHGQRITSFVLTFPRIILAELNTHRMFSRNSASSRAIPFKKMVEKCKNDPFIPIAWQKDHKSMQGTEYFDSDDSSSNKEAWLRARDFAICQAKLLSNDYGVTKQLCNRILEPFMWHTAIVTATEFENFFKQRCPQYQNHLSDEGITHSRSRKDWLSSTKNEIRTNPTSELEWFELNQGGAEIHIMELAEQMWDAMNESEPKQLTAGEWHIPFGDKMDGYKLPIEKTTEGKTMGEKIMDCKIKIAVARCARVSYMNFDGTDDYQKDIELHDRLIKMRHNSPFEHVAQAMTYDEYEMAGTTELIFSEDHNSYINIESEKGGWSGNFQGFIQYRKRFDGEDGRD